MNKNIGRSVLSVLCLLMILSQTNGAYSQSSTRTKIRLFAQTTGFDSIVTRNDSILFFAGDTVYGALLDTISDEDWFKQDTTHSPLNISDSIYTGGEVQITNYPNTRGDDTTAHLNSLYTDATGNIKSARREILPPSPYIDISTPSTGNTFNYYNYYATQLTNIGLTPIPLANLDFYIFAYDPAVFANISINASGVATFDIIANSSTNSCLDVRFYTK